MEIIQVRKVTNGYVALALSKEAGSEYVYATKDKLVEGFRELLEELSSEKPLPPLPEPPRPPVKDDAEDVM